MVEHSYPTADAVRDALLRRADEFTKLTGVPRSAIGKQSINSPGLLSQVENGRNITFGTYERVMSWLDHNWPRASA